MKRIGSVAGIPVLVNAGAAFAALVGYVLLHDVLARTTLAGDATAVALGAVLIFELGVLAHELGHGLAAKAHGARQVTIALLGLNGLTIWRGGDEDAVQRLRITAAGPAATCGVILVLEAIGHLHGWSWKQGTSGLFGDLPRHKFDLILQLSLVIQIYLLGFNILPCLPLDGGQMLRSTIWRVSGDRALASSVVVATTVLGAAVLGGFGLSQLSSGDHVRGLFYVFAAGQLVQGISVERRVEERLRKVSDLRLRNVMLPPRLAPVDGGAPAAQVWEAAFSGIVSTSSVPVVGDGVYLGMAYRDTAEMAASARPDMPIGKLVRAPDTDSRAQVVDPDTSVEAVMTNAVLEAGGALMVVGPDGALLGVVDGEAISAALAGERVRPAFPLPA